jgi:hypothetical protein
MNATGTTPEGMRYRVIRLPLVSDLLDQMGIQSSDDDPRIPQDRAQSRQTRHHAD